LKECTFTPKINGPREDPLDEKELVISNFFLIINMDLRLIDSMIFNSTIKKQRLSKEPKMKKFIKS